MVLPAAGQHDVPGDGVGDKWCEWQMVASKIVLLPDVGHQTPQAPVLLHWLVSPLWLLQSFFFVGELQPCPKSVQCAAYTDMMVRISTAAWNHPKMSPPKHWACKKAPLLRFLKDFLSSAALKYELGFKWKCSGGYSWFVIISHLQT